MFLKIKMYFRNGYTIVPSRVKFKKYDVYKQDQYVISFGDRRYEQYHDKLGYYSHLDHFDNERRRQYKLRHARDHTKNPQYAGYWSWKYLW